MTPDIKFKLWNPDKRVMTAGVALTTLLLTTDADFCKEFERCKMIWLQFTGLKDKTGKEIYRGDLYQVAGNKVYEIRFCEGAESSHEWYGGTFVLYYDEETFFPFDEFAMSSGKVIGNVFQNPELILS